MKIVIIYNSIISQSKKNYLTPQLKNNNITPQILLLL